LCRNINTIKRTTKTMLGANKEVDLEVSTEKM